jgi:hypothetical protein
LLKGLESVAYERMEPYAWQLLQEQLAKEKVKA